MSNDVYIVLILATILCILFCHIVADFNLQTDFMSTYKQKKSWEEHPQYSSMYEDDYKVVLSIHSFQWSFIIHIPLFIFVLVIYVFDIGLENFSINCKSVITLFILSIFANTLVHYIVDDIKANRFKINLLFDQLCHIFQCMITLAIYVEYFQRLR